MKIDVNKKIVDLRKKVIKREIDPKDPDSGRDWTYGEFIAEAILGYKKESDLRKYALSRRFFEASRAIEIDSADFQLIKDAVKESTLFDPVRANGLNTLFKGQLEEYFESLK